MNAVNALINIGGAMMLAMYLGKLELEEGMKYYTLSMLITFLISIIFIISALLFLDPIVNMLCSDDSLKPLVKTYANVVMLSAPLYLFVPGICIFIRIDSNPKLASFVLILANILNLIFDIIFVKYFSMGVFGAALSTSLGYLIGFMFALSHFFKKTSSLKLKFNFEISKIMQIFTTGLPMALASALMTVRLIFVNDTVLNTLGASGMQIMAVCFNILMVASIFIGGSAQALQPIAGVLIGSKDYTGVKIAVNTALKILISFMIVLIMLFPYEFASLFGVSELENLNQSIRIFSLCVTLYALNYIFIVNYQILSKKALSISISCFQALAVIPIIKLIAPHSTVYIWSSFAIGEALVFLGIMIDNILGFLSKNNIDAKFSKKLAICCEELVKNIAAYGYKNSSHRYIDISIKIFPNYISAMIKDDGLPFNPLEFETSENDKGLGITLVKGMCEDIKYSFVANQNMINISVKI